jgi:hypothetical protein
VYGLFVVPIVTGFFSVLGMAIERFQVSEKNNDDIQNHLCIQKNFKASVAFKIDDGASETI